MSTTPATSRGERTRAKIVEAAEHVFADLGFHDASIVKITEAAGVGLGTFYLYFASKLDVFDEVVDDLNRRVRHAMIEASSAAPDRVAAERAGFAAFFQFAAEHPALYRIVRQAEFVSPGALRRHYERIVSGYMTGLAKARADGQVGDDVDPEVAAWALMGIGEIVGMRWVLWPRTLDGEPGAGTVTIPDDVFEQTMAIVERVLASPHAPGVPDGEDAP